MKIDTTYRRKEMFLPFEPVGTERELSGICAYCIEEVTTGGQYSVSREPQFMNIAYTSSNEI
jgi:hypothetical protein